MSNGRQEKNRRDPYVEEMVKRLVSRFHPERIYLFGSRARGKYDQNSDYDLMMIVKDSGEPRYRREQQAFRALFITKL